MKISHVPRKVKDAQTPLCSNPNAISFKSKFIAFLVTGCLVNLGMLFAQSADLDQVRNGSASSPLSPASWVNGNAGPSNAHYSEGYSIPYRMYCTSLTPGPHELIIEWDTKQSNGHAIDYITHYQNMDNPPGSHLATFGHGPEAIDPTIGIGGLGAASTFAIPAPSSTGAEVPGLPTSSFNALPAALRLMTAWNATITSMTYINQDAPDGTTSSTKTSLSIHFTTTGSTALFAWGGHIAAEYDWGVGRGATGVNGSPYHTRLVTIDGKGGNQDRSLKASAVVIPPPLCAISVAQTGCAETASFVFNNNGSSTGTGITYLWALINNTAGAAIDGSATGTSVTIIPSGTDFIAGGSFGLRLTVSRSTGQSTVCERSPAGSIVQLAALASASPTNINLAASQTSQLDVSMAGSDDDNVDNYTYSWTQSPASNGSLDANNVRNPIFTATNSDSWTFEVTATMKAAPFCSTTSTVVVNAGASTPPCKVTGPSPICPSSTNVYKYDYDEDNIANDIPTDYTAQWSFDGNSNGATFSGSTTGNAVTVIAGAECGTSYTVKITLTSTTGLVSTSCFKTVNVEDNTAPTITFCPADVVLDCGASTLPANTGTATASDNCSASVGYSDQTTPGCYTKIVRTWTATDPCGNTATCTQTIIIRDRTAPTINCTGGGTPTVSDNCTATENIMLYSRDDGNTRTWTAVDEAGNVSTCTQDISAPPAITSEAPSSGETQKASTVALTSNSVTKVPAPAKVDDLQVKAYPNPFGTVVNFSFVSPKSGKAVLEIYDLLGRKVGIAYQGNLEANETRTITYKVPNAINSPIVYRLSVSDLRAHGKLMSSRK